MISVEYLNACLKSHPDPFPAHVGGILRFAGTGASYSLPAKHCVHHAVVIRERDKNYGTIFSIWDRILGTLLAKVDQDRIKIGLGAIGTLPNFAWAIFWSCP